MQCTKLEEAKPYEAAKHNGCASFRLQGLDATTTKNFWVGMSHFLPGGNIEPGRGPTEKVYFVISGEITVTSGGKTVVLRQNDSCIIPPTRSAAW
jgi:mannose-6-phosphate isomerase-like protein (cupin superfamily)